MASHPEPPAVMVRENGVAGIGGSPAVYGCCYPRAQELWVFVALRTRSQKSQENGARMENPAAILGFSCISQRQLWAQRHFASKGQLKYDQHERSPHIL